MTTARRIKHLSFATLAFLLVTDADAANNNYYKTYKQKSPSRTATTSPSTVNAFATTAVTASTLTIPNGDFEMGDFSSWNAADNGVTPLQPWEVCQADSCGFFGNAAPIQGIYDLANGFDGGAGYEAFLETAAYIDPNTPILSFYDRIQYDGLDIPSTLPRIYEVLIKDEACNTSVLHHQEIMLNGQPKTDLGWQPRQFDLSGFAGQMVVVKIHLLVPEEFTGPAQIEFDDFNLIAMADIPDVSGCYKQRGLPAVGQPVHLFQPGFPEQITITDANGCYAFSEVIPGYPYDVVTMAPGL